ncbi:hypothetical protein QQ045_007809 [Rhodiola kirilowii]
MRETMVDAMGKVKGPWIWLGDFNCIRSQAKKLNGARVCGADVRELTDFCEKCDLFDIVANDHSPTISFLGTRPLVKKWFRFQASWTCTDEFKSCLIQKWQKGSWNLFLFQSCLKAFKAELKVAMRYFRGDMNIRVERSKQRLIEAQNMLTKNHNNTDLRRFKTMELLNFRKLLKYQHIFNCQRARLNWAKEGDLNTKYFHSVVNGRKSKAAIRCIELQNGELSFNPETIKSHFVKYFQELFNGDFRRVPVDQTLFSLGPKVKESDCFCLVKDITMNEVAEVIKSMPSSKAADLDDFNANFLKHRGKSLKLIW